MRVVMLLVTYRATYHSFVKFFFVFINNQNINQIFRLHASKNPNQHFQNVCCSWLVIPDIEIMVFWKRLHRPKILNAVAKRFNNYHHWLFFYTLNTNNYMIHTRTTEVLKQKSNLFRSSDVILDSAFDRVKSSSFLEI